MAAFDAELYLRMLGERQLLDPDRQRHHHTSPLAGPAAALVFAGAVSPAVAQRVIEDYDAATGVRAGQRGSHFLPSTRRRRPGKLAARRTVILGREIGFGDGRLLLRDLTIGARGGTLRFRWRRDAPAASRGGRVMIGGGGRFPWGAATPVIVDDHGHRPTVGSGSGGGNDDHWDGKLELGGRLAPDLAWLEVDGTRIEVDPRTAAHAVTIEPLPAAETPVERFLWRRLAAAEMPFGRSSDLEPALDALLAAGAIDPDGRLLRDVRAVAAALPEHLRHPHGPPRGGGRGLPEPWRSLLRRIGRQDGLTRTLVVGALTPGFDGIQLAVHSVASDPHGFELEFEVAPNVLQPCPIDALPFAWWARDELGNHHLGSPNGWGGDDHHAEGTLRFWPALHPRATRLELLADADAHRAVISISLTATPERVS